MSTAAIGALNTVNRFSRLAAMPGAELGYLIGTAFGCLRKVVNTVANPILNLGRSCMGKDTVPTKSLSQYSVDARRRCSKVLGLTTAIGLTAPLSPFLASAGAIYGSQQDDLPLIESNLISTAFRGHYPWRAKGLSRGAFS